MEHVFLFDEIGLICKRSFDTL